MHYLWSFGNQLNVRYKKISGYKISDTKKYHNATIWLRNIISKVLRKTILWEYFSENNHYMVEK